MVEVGSVLGEDALFGQHLADLERFRFDGQTTAAFLAGLQTDFHPEG
jgi:hypothetical protein